MVEKDIKLGKRIEEYAITNLKDDIEALAGSQDSFNICSTSAVSGQEIIKNVFLIYFAIIRLLKLNIKVSKLKNYEFMNAK